MLDTFSTKNLRTKTAEQVAAQRCLLPVRKPVPMDAVEACSIRNWIPVFAGMRVKQSCCHYC